MESFFSEMYNKYNESGHIIKKKKTAENFEMSHDEFESWKEVDIKGYDGYLLFIINCSGRIKFWIEKGKKDKVEKYLAELSEICKKFIASIERINANILSDQFMIDDILMLKEKGVKALEEVNDLIISGYKNNSITDDFIKEINKKMYFFIELENKMDNNERYELYRSKAGIKQNRSDSLN